MGADPGVKPSRAPTVDIRWALLTAFSIGGYLAAFWMYLQFSGGDLLTVGADMVAYLRAASDLVAGRPVYVGHIGDLTNFPYAPPWAVIVASLSWLPPPALQALIVAADVAAVRYVTGSWRTMGYVLWFPLIAVVMAAGNLDLLIAAAIVMAWRSTGAPLALFGLAKLAPFLGLPIPWRRDVILTIIVAILITLPWLGLWADWIDYLLRQPTSIRISLPLGPWWLRLPFAIALLVPRRSYFSGLAVIVAMPSLYLSTLSILIAPLFLYLDERGGRRWSRSGDRAGSAALDFGSPST